jgi:glycosidase
MEWRGWDRPNGDLPGFRRVGDGLHPDVESYLFAVVRRWMDPDGDGDPSDGVDGWRLDAADEVPSGFWRRFRRVVKGVNPEAIIVGEIWSDARWWLEGDQFDVVTNYRFSNAVLRLLTQDNRLYTATRFVDDLDAQREGYAHGTVLSMMNLLGSHDMERVVTAMTDPQRHPVPGPDGRTRIPLRDLLPPDEDAYRRMKLAAVFQFTYPGAPIVYYGDEVGMWGGDDPFCRAPMWWPHNPGPPIREDMHAWYKRLARLRRDRVELRRGGYDLILADDARRLLVYRRSEMNQAVITVLHYGDQPQEILLAMGDSARLDGVVVMSTRQPGGGAERPRVEREGDRLRVVCPALSANLLLIRQ